MAKGVEAASTAWEPRRRRRWKRAPSPAAPRSLEIILETKEVTRTFCPECGTSISYFDEGLRDEIYLTIGFFDHPERFPPQAHAYWRMKLPWVDFGDNLPRAEGYSRRRDPALGNPADR